MSYTEKMQKSHASHPMTRRDYELIARAISDLPSAKTRKAVALLFAHGLGACPGFRESRFLAACGVSP